MEHLRTKKEILKECEKKYDKYIIRALKHMENSGSMELCEWGRSFIFKDTLKKIYSKKDILKILESAILTREVEKGWVWVKGYKIIGKNKGNSFMAYNGKLKANTFIFNELNKCYVFDGKVITEKSGFHLFLNIRDLKKFLPSTMFLKNVYFYECIALVQIEELFNYAFLREISSKKIILKKQLTNKEKRKIYFNGIKTRKFTIKEQIKKILVFNVLRSNNNIEEIKKEVSKWIEI